MLCKEYSERLHHHTKNKLKILDLSILVVFIVISVKQTINQNVLKYIEVVLLILKV